MAKHSVSDSTIIEAAPSFTDELDTEKGENRRLSQFGSVAKFGTARNVKLGRHCRIIQHWGDC